jgi:hypothetical protein
MDSNSTSSREIHDRKLRAQEEEKLKQRSMIQIKEKKKKH